MNGITINDIDNKDILILKFLKKNPKYEASELAKILHLSNEDTQHRLTKLENRDYINYQVNINPNKLNYYTTAFLKISLSTCINNHLIKELSRIPEIVESYYVSGKYSLLVKLVCKNNIDLVDIVEDIQKINDVKKIRTSVCLEPLFKRQVLI